MDLHQKVDNLSQAAGLDCEGPPLLIREERKAQFEAKRAEAKKAAETRRAEAIKAIGKKIALEGNIQGNKPEEKIRRMESEIAKAPAEMKPVMQALLANWYWHYFQQNRWR